MSGDQASAKNKRHIVLISGMSGAGLSTAREIFEDLGYEAVDNLRLGLVPALIDDKPTLERNLAISIDTRNVNFTVEDLLKIDQQLVQRDELKVSLLFLDCSNEVLQQRFTETRRRHPLAFDRPVMDGIIAERELLLKIKNKANLVVDTSETSVHDLRRLISGHFPLDGANALTLSILSFSYRHGIPREADLVFDARFLSNPYWDKSLRAMSGHEAPVGDHIRQDPHFALFMDHLTQLLLPLLPRYQLEGKSYLTIAIGCSGGHHRSVYVANELGRIFAENGYPVIVRHRELEQEKKKG